MTMPYPIPTWTPPHWKSVTTRPNKWEKVTRPIKRNTVTRPDTVTSLTPRTLNCEIFEVNPRTCKKILSNDSDISFPELCIRKCIAFDKRPRIQRQQQRPTVVVTWKKKRDTRPNTRKTVFIPKAITTLTPEAVDCEDLKVNPSTCNKVLSGFSDTSFPELCVRKCSTFVKRLLTQKSQQRVARKNQQRPTISVTWKLIPNIDTTQVPLLSQKQWMEYHENIERIKRARQQPTLYYVKTTDNVTLALLTVLVLTTLLILIVAVWFACFKHSNRMLYKEPVAALPAKSLDYLRL